MSPLTFIKPPLHLSVDRFYDALVWYYLRRMNKFIAYILTKLSKKNAFLWKRLFTPTSCDLKLIKYKVFVFFISFDSGKT